MLSTPIHRSSLRSLPARTTGETVVLPLLSRHPFTPARTPSGLGGGPSEPSFEAAAQNWMGSEPFQAGHCRRDSKQATNLLTLEP